MRLGAPACALVNHACGPAPLAGFPQRRQSIASWRLQPRARPQPSASAWRVSRQAPLRIRCLLFADAAGLVALEVDPLRATLCALGSRCCACNTQARRSGARARRALDEVVMDTELQRLASLLIHGEHVGETGDKGAMTTLSCLAVGIASPIQFAALTRMRRAGAMILNCWRCGELGAARTLVGLGPELPPRLRGGGQADHGGVARHRPQSRRGDEDELT